MKNVAELVRKPTRYRLSKDWSHNWPLPDTLMGIEVEVEREPGVVLPETRGTWTTHNDGSLQNGVEFVLAVPLSGSELRGAINELMKDSTFTRTMTGSTHIHMDMLEDETSPEVLRTMVMLVYTLEPMLYAAGDASREWCGYANRLMSGPDSIISTVMNDNVSQETFSLVYGRRTSKFGRYYGLNMAALLDYGSLEFRYFPTATSEQELINWVELVQTFKLAATALGGRTALSDIIEDEGRFNEFLYQYFGKWEHLFTTLGGYRNLRDTYRKAYITANVNPQKEKRFIALKVLSNEKFKALLKFPPKEVGRDGGDLYPIINRDADPSPIPQATEFPEGMMMIYGRSLYHTSDIFSSGTHPRPQNWYVVGDYPDSAYQEDQRMVNTLLTIQEEYAESLNPRFRDIIENILSSTTEEADDEEEY